MRYDDPGCYSAILVSEPFVDRLATGRFHYNPFLHGFAGDPMVEEVLLASGSLYNSSTSTVGRAQRVPSDKFTRASTCEGFT